VSWVASDVQSLIAVIRRSDQVRSKMEILRNHSDLDAVCGAQLAPMSCNKTDVIFSGCRDNIIRCAVSARILFFPSCIIVPGDLDPLHCHAADSFLTTLFLQFSCPCDGSGKRKSASSSPRHAGSAGDGAHAMAGRACQETLFRPPDSRRSPARAAGSRHSPDAPAHGRCRG